MLKNAWYVACTPDEVRERPLSRMICGVQMVFFHGEENRIAAVEDFCPHRGARLSLGFLSDGKLVCGYHGLVMGCDGRVVSMPGQRVKNFTPIRSFPVVERYGFIWVWPGEASRADPATIHHLEWADSDQWAYGGGLYHIACDYRLMIDNLMDLTHETYVHSTSIGQPEIDETPCTTHTEGNEVVTSRFMNGIHAPPFWQAVLRMRGLPDSQPVDRWQICRFTPPSHVMIEVGVALAGKGGHEAPDAVKASSIVVDFITPERDDSIWYFWGMARKFNTRDAALTAALREAQGKVFSEDKATLEAQQLNLASHPGRKLMVLNIDSGGVRARKVLERLLMGEDKASAGAAVTQ